MQISENPNDTSIIKRTTLARSITRLVPRRWRDDRALPQEQKSATTPWYRLRRDRVERAKQLIADVTYPPREVLRAVAETLIRHIKFWQLLPYLYL